MPFRFRRRKKNAGLNDGSGVSVSKYGAVKCEIDGIKFDSKKEGRRYSELRLREVAGEIEDLVCHPKFKIEINEIKICAIELDFQYFLVSQQKIIYEDVKPNKSLITSTSRLKKKLLEAQNGIEVDWII